MFEHCVLAYPPIGLLTGSLWANTPHTCQGLLLFASLIFHCCISVVLSVAMDMAPMYNERVVFYKQRDSFFYGTIPYWIANNFYRIFIWGARACIFADISLRVGAQACPCHTHAARTQTAASIWLA